MPQAKTTFFPQTGKWLIAISFSIQFLYAQENIRFDHITPNDGLSQADVRAMAQDKLGFLWIGTRDGLNRYDGNTFKRFQRKQGDTTAIAFNQISDIEVDPSGDVWASSIDGISCYNYAEDNFSNYPYGVQNKYGEINDLFLNKDSSIICSTTEGLVTFDRKKKKFFTAPDHIVFLDMGINQFDYSIHGTWVATDKGLYIRRPGETAWTIVLEGNIIHHLLFEKDQAYISSASGLFRYSFSDELLTEIPLPKDNIDHGPILTSGKSGILGTLRDQRGDLWVACNKLILLDKNDRVKQVFVHDSGNEKSISENLVRTLFQTSDQTIWIGTFGYGINKFNPQVSQFGYLAEDSGLKLNSSYISSLYTPNDTVLYIGTMRGLNVVDLQKQTVTNYLEEKSVNLIFKIKADVNGIIWVSSSKGLFQFQKDQLIQRNSALKEINDIIEWDSKTLLLATRLEGLLLFNKSSGNIEPFILPPLLPEVVSCLYLDKTVLWVGSRDGLRAFDREGKLMSHFKNDPTRKNCIHSNYIKTIIIDHMQQLWIGTWGGGISKFNERDSTFTTYDMDDGLSNNTIYGIVEDDLGMLWMSTNFGLSVFDPRKELFKNFDYRDGLQGNEFNTGAYFQSISGKIYFGGLEGLTFFDPSGLLKTEPPPPIVITHIMIDNEKYQSATNVMLKQDFHTPWYKNNIKINFSTIEFKNPEKVSFQYSLDDASWFDLGSQRSIDLVDLGSGKHRIKIRARKSGSSWSTSNEALVSIHVDAPFWRTAAGLIFLLLVLAFVAFALIRMRLQVMKTKNLELNRRVFEFTKEIQLKNHEIESQNEQLQKQTTQLTGQNAILDEQRLQLLNHSTELKKRVEERVKDIEQLNQELLEKNMQLQQFYFITAHNFTGPLSRINALLSSISKGRKDIPEILSIELRLHDAVSELNEVMNELDNVTMISKRTMASLDEVDLQGVLEKSLTMLENEIRSKHIKVDTHEFKSFNIKGTKTYIQSIFHSLLHNAIESSTSAKEPFMKILSELEVRKVKVKIIHNGSSLDLRKAMNNMFRVDNRYTPGKPGNGMDLYLIKTQMDIMGGEISIETAKGEGTTYTLYFGLD